MAVSGHSRFRYTTGPSPTVFPTGFTSEYQNRIGLGMLAKFEKLILESDRAVGLQCTSQLSIRLQTLVLFQ